MQLCSNCIKQGNLNECSYYAETDTNTKPDK